MKFKILSIAYTSQCDLIFAYLSESDFSLLSVVASDALWEYSCPLYLANSSSFFSPQNKHHIFWEMIFDSRLE